MKKDTPPNKKFPLVIVKEIRDNLYDENLDKTDQRFRIGYEIEIYAVNKDNVAKQTITNELIKLINDVFDEHYGMNREIEVEVEKEDGTKSIEMQPAHYEYHDMFERASWGKYL